MPRILPSHGQLDAGHRQDILVVNGSKQATLTQNMRTLPNVTVSLTQQSKGI